MRWIGKDKLSSIVIILAILITGCGSFSPPESCGSTNQGTADQNVFDQGFTSMALLDEASGQPGAEDPEGGVGFGSGDRLIIRVASLKPTTVNICIQQRAGGGKIVLSREETLEVGSVDIALGSFAKGSYVVRVIQEGVLIKNFPLSLDSCIGDYWLWPCSRLTWHYTSREAT